MKNIKRQSSMNLNELKDRAYKCACEHGFHDAEYPYYHWLMLTICELGEAVEADRCNRHADKEAFERMMKDHILKDDTDEDIVFYTNFKKYIKDTVEDELADVVIRMLDFAGLMRIDLTDLQAEVDNRETENSDVDASDLITSSYAISAVLSDIHEDLAHIVCGAIAGVILYAHQNNIDLEWHIEQKMRYNGLRPMLNGKKY